MRRARGRNVAPGSSTPSFGERPAIISAGRSDRHARRRSAAGDAEQPCLAEPGWQRDGLEPPPPTVPALDEGAPDVVGDARRSHRPAGARPRAGDCVQSRARRAGGQWHTHRPPSRRSRGTCPGQDDDAGRRHRRQEHHRPPTPRRERHARSRPAWGPPRGEGGLRTTMSHRAARINLRGSVAGDLTAVTANLIARPWCRDAAAIRRPRDGDTILVVGETGRYRGICGAVGSAGAPADRRREPMWD